MTSNEKITDAYGLARALLTDRGADGLGHTSEVTSRTLLDWPDSMRVSIWGALADEAEYHGVAPLIEPMIAALAVQLLVPDEVRRAFVVLASRHRHVAAVREGCIDKLLETFATAGVPVLLLKGAALAHRIYFDPGLRPMVDIDVLIDPANAERAVSIARDLGYSFASGHGSRFSGRMHHLPVATMLRSGFRIALEIHLDAMSSSRAVSLTFDMLTAKPQPFRRGTGPDGLTLGHTDMLRHLANHVFEPARRVRLIHLYDLWRYQMIFHDEIEWRVIEARFPKVITILRLVCYVFASAHSAHGSSTPEAVPKGVGSGMVPFSEIAAADINLVAKLAAVFNPPAWWLHGFYGVPPERSLLICRTVRHPASMVRWLMKRLVASVITAPTLTSDDHRDQRCNSLCTTFDPRCLSNNDR